MMFCNRNSIKLVVFTAVVGLGWVMGAAAQDSIEIRTWHAANDDQAFDAKLLDYSQESKQVRLQAADGTLIEKQLTDLSPTDRRYVTRTMRSRRRQQAASSLAESQPSSRQRGAQSARAAGLNWIDDASSASEIARGDRDAIQDDKPILWFRVLGDLTGFM